MMSNLASLLYHVVALIRESIDRLAAATEKVGCTSQ